MKYINTLTKNANTSLTILLIGALTLPYNLAWAADDSLTIASASLELIVDADSNSIANIGDTIRVSVEVANTDGYDSTTVAADLKAYGYSDSESLDQGSGGTENLFSKNFVIVDAGLSGIDVLADNADSSVLITATDSDEVTTKTTVTNTLGTSSGGIAATNGVVTYRPYDQNAVFSANKAVTSGKPVAITASDRSTNTIWFAPAGTTEFVASSTKTSVAGSATSIIAPSTIGDYKLYVIDRAGQVSLSSTATLEVQRSGGGGALLKKAKVDKKSKSSKGSVKGAKTVKKPAQVKTTPTTKTHTLSSSQLSMILQQLFKSNLSTSQKIALATKLLNR